MSAADLMASRARVVELEGRVSELTDAVRVLAAVVSDLAQRDVPRVQTDAAKALAAAWAVGP